MITLLFGVTTAWKYTSLNIAWQRKTGYVVWRCYILGVVKPVNSPPVRGSLLAIILSAEYWESSAVVLAVECTSTPADWRLR